MGHFDPAAGRVGPTLRLCATFTGIVRARLNRDHGERSDHQDISIAVEDAEFFAQKRMHQTTVYFSSSQSIQFREESLDDFAKRLLQAYEVVHRPSRAPAEAPGHSPQVFLSYAREDRDAVDALGETLRSAGINVWQDHQNLRAGDRWEQVLSQVIQKQVDYVVVIQSPAMAKRTESYVGLEVREALRREGTMLWGARFILPVTLGPAQKLPALRPFNTVDVSAGCQALIQSVLEDWALRQKRLAGEPVREASV